MSSYNVMISTTKKSNKFIINSNTFHFDSQKFMIIVKQTDIIGYKRYFITFLSYIGTFMIRVIS